ncbi:claudin-4-like [Oreochromis aureus]|uniref:claudin-4-like n=1 Tax=Oreochromis aureus TaxID=47969 RepID=UPI00195388CD|nr:claudin-4-like [Oreochromis aureus]
MASMGMQMLASALCLFGWAGVIVICLLPMWRVSSFVGTSIVTSQIFWEGIWMACVVQSTGQIQCKPYESLLALSGDMQAARALTVISITVGAAGLIMAFVGGKCTRFLDETGNGAKGKMAVVAGAVLMAAGLFCLIPTSWVAGALVKNFYSAYNDAEKREIGACLYIGWGASVLLVLGGGLFISSACPIKAHDTEKRTSVRYQVVRSYNGSNLGGSHRSRAPSAKLLPVGVDYPRPHGYEGVTSKPQQYTRPPSYQDMSEQGSKEESEKSWAPSTKSQLKKADSTKSKHSDVPSTKSQLKEAEMDTLSVKSDGEDLSSNPPKTYL